MTSSLPDRRIPAVRARATVRTGRRSAVALVASAALSLAACGSDGGDVAGDSPSAATTTTDPDPSTTTITDPDPSTTTTATTAAGTSTTSTSTTTSTSSTSSTSTTTTTVATSSTVDPVACAVDAPDLTIVLCLDPELGQGVLLAETGPDAELGPNVRWFAAGQFAAFEGLAELTGPVTVDGLPGAVAFEYDPFDGLTCVQVIDIERASWREICSEALGPVLTVWGGEVVHLDLADPSAPVAVTLDDADATAVDELAPCALADLAAILAVTSERGTLVTELGCAGDLAALTEGSAITRPGPPDGLITNFARRDGTWEQTELGTGIEHVVPVAPIPPYDAPTA